ncbi:MAG: N-(5'-phosphoribosyl)anthranilate isomerase [Nitrospinae bacterium RIFCSPLOWO2_12_FULL_45_22]|nr:MAG: N-(5'-phosphoribosyl)anthranilate isomerase [Nitrospinae bacterium RIFCSPLOWO2_12_FULL_45_22]
MIKVKICGITNLDDALDAIEAGADALGFVFYPPSPRYIPPEILRQWIGQLPPFVTKVGVFVDEKLDNIIQISELCRIVVVQLHGHESTDLCKQVPKPVIKAFRLRSEEDLATLLPYSNNTVSALLLDSYSEKIPGGTGRSFDWNLAKQAKAYGRIILAGGLSPENVRQAVIEVQPYAVDVSTGVELSLGKKDKTLMKRFVKEANGASEEAK